MQKRVKTRSYVTHNTINLAIPTPAHRQQVETFKTQFLKTEPHIDGGGNLGVLEFDQWLQQVADHRQGKNLPDGYTPSTLFLAIRESDNKMVGVIQIRHDLIPPWKDIGGHIGYSTAPDERGKGYATEMLRLALPKCAELGLHEVWLTCVPENAASAKVITNNGGMFMGTSIVPQFDTVPSHYVGKTLHRYRIAIPI